MSLFSANPSFAAVRLHDRPARFVSERNWRWTTTIHGYYNLWIALRGSGTMRVDGLEFPITPGTAFVLAPGQSVDAGHDPADPIHNLAVHFHALDSRGRSVAPREFPLAGVKISDSILVESTGRALARLYGGNGKDTAPCADAWAYALVLQIIRDTHEPRRDPMDECILRIAERIRAHPARPASIHALAAEAGLSRVQFTRRFYRVTGMPPNRFVIHRRIERAVHLIEHSPLKLADIAETLGYSDLYFFSRQFKAVKGFPPSRLRRVKATRP